MTTWGCVWLGLAIMLGMSALGTGIGTGIKRGLEAVAAALIAKNGWHN